MIKVSRIQHEVKNMDFNKRAVLTTQEAAERLGVSTTSIQKMVNRGELEAWVTPGGHRRIYSDSLERMAVQPRKGSATERSAAALRVLLVESDQEQIALFRQLEPVYGGAIEVGVAQDGSQALIQIERLRPDVVFGDLVTEPLASFNLLGAILTEEAYAGMDVVVISASPASEIAARVSLPPGVPVYPKPVSVERLMGFFDALLSRVGRRMRAGAAAMPTRRQLASL
jgi:excisionase family DNA binding protein